MIIEYRLNKNIVSRVAIQLNFLLNTIKDSIFIIKDNRCFNGKSLVGILANNLKNNDTIRIETSRENISKMREIFNTVGEEVK